ncbi:MAG: hypothetical protein AVDCRST_MAG33-932 [uncultured Thermomicrobiales bacterium]|uniref:Uncharacterized protein n=1 Tax=uncultured Thermomicrobiales bacterium TaxID=1645740 RepID=A0A6J4UIM5_9BACT|nr:MAG: hypothetical protein AVDCRST_MAG33-932 [uncultured Thermomicrobiales bacterium]
MGDAVHFDRLQVSDHDSNIVGFPPHRLVQIPEPARHGIPPATSGWSISPVEPASRPAGRIPTGARLPIEQQRSGSPPGGSPARSHPDIRLPILIREWVGSGVRTSGSGSGAHPPGSGDRTARQPGMTDQTVPPVNRSRSDRMAIEPRSA